MGTNTFGIWLDEQLKERSWTQGILAKRAGITQGYVSQVINGDKSPSWKFCEKVAGAFGYSPIEVFREAGLLPSSNVGITDQIVDTLNRLPKQKQMEVAKYTEYLLAS